MKNLQNSEKAMFCLRDLYRHYGYQPYKMSRWEEYELYVRNKDFLVSDQVITFSDRSGRLLALKPDVTLSIIKNAPESLSEVQKVYYNENVYRADKSSGVFKEILQTGLECIGNLGMCEITEVVLLAAKSLALMGQHFVLDLSHMGLISAVMDAAGLSEDQRYQAATYLRQKNTHELRELCIELKCADDVAAKLCALVEYSGSMKWVLAQMEIILTREQELRALSELKMICSVLSEQGFEDNVRIDFSVGSDMKYYSGVVFKGYLEGVPASILSGGRYDKLLLKMGKSGGAIGFAIYLDMLEQLQKSPKKYDLDTVFLHKETDMPTLVMALTEGLRESFEVLSVTTLPVGRTWRRLYELRDGEAVLVEDNG